jgi:hypothetical protein
LDSANCNRDGKKRLGEANILKEREGDRDLTAAMAVASL